MAFARLYIQKFSRGRMPPHPPTTVAATLWVGQTKDRPPKISWPVRLCVVCHCSRIVKSCLLLILKFIYLFEILLLEVWLCRQIHSFFKLLELYRRANKICQGKLIVCTRPNSQQIDEVLCKLKGPNRNPFCCFYFPLWKLAETY